MRVDLGHAWIRFDQRISHLQIRPLAHNTSRMVFFFIVRDTVVWLHNSARGINMGHSCWSLSQKVLIYILRIELILLVWPSHCGCQAIVIENLTPVRHIICCQNCVWNNNPRSLTMFHGNPLCLTSCLRTIGLPLQPWLVSNKAQRSPTYLVGTR